MMRLEIGSFEVTDVIFDKGPCRLEGGILHVDSGQLERFLAQDPQLKRVTVTLAKPGDRTRIVHALDVVEPRVKVAGGRSAFPGFLGPVETAGRGRTHRLANTAVIQTVDEFWVYDGLTLREAIVDMSGPGAAYSPFGQTMNVVVSCGFAPQTGFRDRTEVVARVGLRAAQFLAETVRNATPDAIETWELVRASAPRIGYLCFLMTEGEVNRSYVYGANVAGLPTLLHPNEILDGAVVSGDYHTACWRNVTYLQQNNPVIRGFKALHGREVDFAGVIIAKALATTPEEKQRIAQHCATLAELLGLEGVILSQASAGHATVDLMGACRELERRGIKTVLIHEELAGADGGGLGVPHYVPEANAMVSTGNRDALIELPAMERVIGGEELLNPTLEGASMVGPASGAFETSLRHILCSTNQVGFGYLTTQTY